MGLRPGQTVLDTLVVSLVSEEPEGLAPVTGQCGQWEALQALSVSQTPAQIHKENLLKRLNFY